MSLVSSKITSAKGTNVDTLAGFGARQLNVLNFDLPIIDPSDIPNFTKFIDSYITEYNAYLGYDSGITTNGVRNLFNSNLKLYCMFLSLKRAYDSKNWLMPTGIKLKGKLGNAVRFIKTDGSYSDVYRYSSSIMKLNNDVWNNEFISPVTQLCLPPNVMAFYDYYLSNYFDITDDNTKESQSLMCFWPEDQTFTLSSGEIEDYQFDGTKWNELVANVEGTNTDAYVKFVTRFLNWSRPNKDFTRDKYGNTVNILKDISLIDQLNNMYPEAALIVANSDDARNYPCFGLYYYDFEQLYQYDESEPEELVALSYFFGLNPADISSELWTQENSLDSIILDYDYMPLLCLLSLNEENTHSGGLLNVATSYNMVNATFDDSTEIFSIGNDVEIMWSTIEGSPLTTELLPIYAVSGLLTQFNEAPEFNDELSIFKFPFEVKEGWLIAGEIIEEGHGDYFSITSLQVYTLRGSYGDIEYNNKFWLTEHGFVHKYAVTEVHASMAAVGFRMLTTFYTSLAEANRAIDAEFNGNQQEEA